jgi:hypothetical protein
MKEAQRYERSLPPQPTEQQQAAYQQQVGYQQQQQAYLINSLLLLLFQSLNQRQKNGEKRIPGLVMKNIRA